MTKPQQAHDLPRYRPPSVSPPAEIPFCGGAAEAALVECVDREAASREEFSRGFERAQVIRRACAPRRLPRAAAWAGNQGRAAASVRRPP